MAGTKDPMFDPKLTVGIPDHVVELIKECVVAAQKYGVSTARAPARAPTLMSEQKQKVQELFVALQAELSKRYEAGLEISRE